MSRLCKKDCRFIVEVIAFILTLYGISSFVYLNGDDFMYGAFAHTGIVSNVADYYFTGNGRFWINILDASLLWFDRFGFVLALPWIVLSFVVLLAKNIQRIMANCSDAEKEKELIRMGMVLFCCLDILCLRETVFWITGMMNYLFPAVMFLWAYLMFQKSRAGELHGLSRIGYYLVCLLTASSVEQYALMFVGMMTLHHGDDLLKKRRISRSDWLAYVLALLGLSALILAPGNFVRVDTQGETMPSFIENAWTLLFQDALSPVAIPFVIMLSMAVCLPKGDLHNWTVLQMSVHALFLAGAVVAPFVDKAIFNLALLAMLGCLILYQIFRYKTVFLPSVYFLAFVGIGSQIMLLISAVWGYRCMLSLYVIYMLLIGCLLYHADAARRLFVLSSGILASIRPAATLLFWCTVCLLRRKGRFGRKLSAGIACCASALALLTLLVGYGQNAETHKLNLQRTDARTNQAIVIQELPDDLFSWYFVPVSEFHEKYYRIFHEIPEDVEIVYQTISEPIN